MCKYSHSGDEDVSIWAQYWAQVHNVKGITISEKLSLRFPLKFISKVKKLKTLGQSYIEADSLIGVLIPDMLCVEDIP